MAKKNNFKQVGSERFQINKKNYYALGAVFFLSALIFLSFDIDSAARSLFKSAQLGAFDLAFSIITNFGLLVVFMLLIPWILLFRKDIKNSILLAFVFFLASFLNFLLKQVVQRSRPLENINYPFFGIVDYSFPSMHAMVSFSLLPLLVYMLPKYKHFYILFAVLIAISRVYFGLHFLSDVLFGAIFGLFLGQLSLDLSKMVWNR
jgi:undecaprenyl-diphosphatase